jgi:hypothetical protein
MEKSRDIDESSGGKSQDKTGCKERKEKRERNAVGDPGFNNCVDRVTDL